MVTYDECAEFLAKSNGYANFEKMIVQSQAPHIIYRKLAEFYADQFRKGKTIHTQYDLDVSEIIKGLDVIQQAMDKMKIRFS